MLDPLAAAGQARELHLCPSARTYRVCCQRHEAGERYDVSMKAGERVLLPAVRAAGPDTLIVSDGFSCRSQIKHGSDRTALHLAQVAQLALRGDQTVPHAYPERRLVAAPDAA